MTNDRSPIAHNYRSRPRRRPRPRWGWVGWLEWDPPSRVAAGLRRDRPYGTHATHGFWAMGVMSPIGLIRFSDGRWTDPRVTAPGFARARPQSVICHLSF